MTNEKFCLKWNDFEKNISGAFRDLKNDNDFFDVTLACDDEEQVSAHKVILSACSPFFRQVLRRHKHQHPLLYIRGVSLSDLESVLAFMYHGEVNIAQQDLNSFLAIAEDLKVKGLTQGKEGAQSNTERPKSPLATSKPSQRSSNLMQPLLPPKDSKRPRHEPAKYEDEEEIQEVVPVKTEAGTIAMAMDEATYDGEGYEDYTYDDQHYEGVGAGAMIQGMDVPKGFGVGNPRDFEQFIVALEEGRYGCAICKEFTHKCKHNVKTHVEAKHFKGYFSYSCDICGATSTTMGALATHKSRHHKKC